MSEKPASKGFFRNFYDKHPVISHLFFIILTGILLLAGALVFLNFWTRHGDNAIVPSIKNMSYAEAAATLESNGLSIAIADSVYNSAIAPGTVLESWPHAGAVIKAGREVYVTISSFQPKKVKITMPLAGVSSRQAMSYLQSIEIRNIRIVNVPSQYADLVERAKYNGKNLEPGMEIPVTATVTLEVGTVPQSFFESDSISDTEAEEETSIIEELTGIYD